MGLVSVENVSRAGCDLLVASDPATSSGKAAKARRYGVPIAAVNDFLTVSPGSTIHTLHFAAALETLRCELCGETWTRPSGRARRPTRCEDCALASLPPTSAPALQVPTQNEETLTCTGCGRTWARVRSAGRKPHYCPICRSQTGVGTSSGE